MQYADDITLCFRVNSNSSLDIQTLSDLNKCVQHFSNINIMAIRLFLPAQFRLVFILAQTPQAVAF